MSWVLMIFLASGLSGPVEMDREPCLLMAAAVAAGEPVLVELEDKSIHLVVRAECSQREVLGS